MNIKLTLCSLASGSKGNAIYVGVDKTKVLIDAGLSGKELHRRLKKIGVHGEDLDAIIVSHEHTDHVRGLQPFSHQSNLPICINYPTLSHTKSLTHRVNVREFTSGESFSVKDLLFQPFSVPHDAADPVGFTIQYKEIKIGIATDLGFATKLVIERLKKCDLLVLESNHDDEMLKLGPYPWQIKQRIKSRLGHLSNKQTGTLIKEIYHKGLKHIILFHISEMNNRPEKAHAGITHVLKRCKYHPIDISMAQQQRVGKIISIT